MENLAEICITQNCKLNNIVEIITDTENERGIN